ncbi:MAG: hypothetical protein K2L72_06250, partial [Clostridia bacterium]|nr:hypothetical protein [Clostridia bacterium]
AYIGFCLRSRKIALGSGSIDVLKKGVYLIIVCSSASENTFKLAVKFKNRYSCPLLICKTGLENAVHKSGCKVAAVRDAELARAICANAGADYELYAER